MTKKLPIILLAGLGLLGVGCSTKHSQYEFKGIIDGKMVEFEEAKGFIPNHNILTITGQDSTKIYLDRNYFIEDQAIKIDEVFEGLTSTNPSADLVSRKATPQDQTEFERYFSQIDSIKFGR